MKKLLPFLLILLGILALCVASRLIFGQASPFRTPRATFTDPNGVPLAGGCIFTYQGGTTTPLATYTDSTGGTANPNPVVLDSTGSATMWLGANTYKFVAYSAGGTNCSTGMEQWSVDEVPGDIWIGGTISGAGITGATITNSTIDSSTIGGTTPAPVNASYFNGPIGTSGGAPAKGVFTALAGTIDQMSYAASPIFDAGSYTVFTMTLTGNVSSSTVSGGITGQFIQFNVCQDTAGSHTFAWPANFVNAPTIPSVPSTCTSPMFFYDGTNWQYVNELGPTSVASFLTVAFSSTPTFPVNPASIFAFTLAGNVTSSTITGSVLGQQITMLLCQNGTGGSSFTWPTQFLNPPPVPEAPSACITPAFVYNGANWVQLGVSQASSAQAVAFTATPAFNAAAYNQFSMTLTGNVTSGTITNGYFGQVVSFSISQDATGSRTFAWPGNILSAPTISAAANSTTNVLAVYNGTNWYAVGANVSNTSATITNCLTTACAGGSTYAAGTTYTNHSSNVVTELVNIQGWDTTGGCTGPSGMLTGTVNGSAVLYAEINNDCNTGNISGFALPVPPGASFSATITCVGTCSGSYTVNSWHELNP